MAWSWFFPTFTLILLTIFSIASFAIASYLIRDLIKERQKEQNKDVLP